MTKAEWKARALAGEANRDKQARYWYDQYCERVGEAWGLRVKLWATRDKLEELEGEPSKKTMMALMLLMIFLSIVIYGAGVLTGQAM